MSEPIPEGELADLLDGFYAYETGSHDSGIRHDALKAKVAAKLLAMSRDDRRRLLSRIVRDLFLSDEALDQGYGYEDAVEFGKWLADWRGSGT